MVDREFYRATIDHLSLPGYVNSEIPGATRGDLERGS